MYAIKTLSDQALRAMYNVLVLLKLSLILKQKCYCLIEWLHLCYCTLLNCGGIYDYKEIDEIQLTFDTILLGVKKQTSTIAVYGELGCYPLWILCLERSMKY